MTAQRVALTIVLLPLVPIGYAWIYVLSAAWTLAWDTAGAVLKEQ